MGFLQDDVSVRSAESEDSALTPPTPQVIAYTSHVCDDTQPQ